MIHSVDHRGLNRLWPSDVIWRDRRRSTFAQVMVCCLTAPSHYLNQCWCIINQDQWHSSEGNFARDTTAINQYDQLKNCFSKMSFKLPEAIELTNWGLVKHYAAIDLVSIGSSHTASPNHYLNQCLLIGNNILTDIVIWYFTSILK